MCNPLEGRQIALWMHQSGEECNVSRGRLGAVSGCRVGRSGEGGICPFPLDLPMLSVKRNRIFR